MREADQRWSYNLLSRTVFTCMCVALSRKVRSQTKSARLLRTSTELLLQIRLLLPLELLLSELLLNTRLCPVAPVSMLPYAVEDEESKQVLDNAEEKRCRLCLGGDEDGPLVQPCACRGTAKWVQREPQREPPLDHRWQALSSLPATRPWHPRSRAPSTSHPADHRRCLPRRSRLSTL